MGRLKTLVKSAKKAVNNAGSSISKAGKAATGAATEAADRAKAAAEAAAKQRADQAAAAAKAAKAAADKKAAEAAAAARAKAVAMAKAAQDAAAKKAAAAAAKKAADAAAAAKKAATPTIKSPLASALTSKVAMPAGVKAMAPSLPSITNLDPLAQLKANAPSGGVLGTLANNITQDPRTAILNPMAGAVSKDMGDLGIVGRGLANVLTGGGSEVAKAYDAAFGKQGQGYIESNRGQGKPGTPGPAPTMAEVAPDFGNKVSDIPQTAAPTQVADPTAAQAWVDPDAGKFSGAVTVAGETAPTTITTPASTQIQPAAGTLPTAGGTPTSGTTPVGQTTNAQGQTSTSTAAAGQGGITSPLGLAGVGGNADQAKMMGTPAQQMGTGLGNREDTLANQTRYNKGARGATEAEMQAQSVADKYKTLGSLDGRVEALVQKRLATPAVSAPTTIDTDKIRSTFLSGMDKASQDAIIPLVEAWAKDPSATNAAALQNKMPGTQLTPALAQQMFVGADTATAGLAAKAVGPITMASLAPEDWAAIGFRDAADVAATLGPPHTAESVAAMTPKQIAEFAAIASKAVTLPLESMYAQLNDPNVPEAQKQAIREQLAGMGQVGYAQAAEKTAGEVAQAGQADSVDFLGKQITLDSLLSGANPEINKVVGEFLSTPDSEQSKLLAEKYPELAAWAVANKQAILDSQVAMGQGLESFGELQDKNKAIGTIGSVSLDESVMKSIVPSWGQAQAGEYDISNSGLLSWLKASETQDPAIGAGFADMVNWAAKNNMADAVEDMNSMSPAALSRLFSSPAEMKEVLTWRAALQNLDKGQFSPADIEKIVAGPSGTLDGKSFDQIISTINDNEQWGTASPSMISLRNSLDANRDGKVDDPATAGVALKDLLAKQGLSGSTSLSELASKGTSSTASTGLKMALSGPGGEQLNTVKGIFGTASVTPELVKSANLSPSQIGQLIEIYGPDVNNQVKDPAIFNTLYEKQYPLKFPTPTTPRPTEYTVTGRGMGEKLWRAKILKEQTAWDTANAGYLQWFEDARKAGYSGGIK
jgi:hypothetical protein